MLIILQDPICVSISTFEAKITTQFFLRARSNYSLFNSVDNKKRRFVGVRVVLSRLCGGSRGTRDYTLRHSFRTFNFNRSTCDILINLDWWRIGIIG